MLCKSNAEQRITVLKRRIQLLRLSSCVLLLLPHTSDSDVCLISTAAAPTARLDRASFLEDASDQPVPDTARSAKQDPSSAACMHMLWMA